MKKMCCLICVLFLVLGVSSCMRDTSTSSNSSGDISSNRISSAPGDSEESVEPEEFGEPLPDTPVVTPKTDQPVYEINAKWSKTVNCSTDSTVQDFANGDFVFCETRFSREEGEPWYLPLTIARYDKNGKLQWKKSYDDLTDSIYTTQALSDGSLLILTDAGFEPLLPEEELTPYSWGHSYGMFTKVSPQGDIVWSRKLTHNYESFSEVFEAENGDLCTAGSYLRADGHIDDQNEAMDPWFHCDTDVAFRVTLTRYNKDGEFLSYHLPPHGVYIDHIGSESSDCTAAYVKGVGLLVNFGTAVVCYDAQWKEKWNYTFPDMVLDYSVEDTQKIKGLYEVDPSPIVLTERGLTVENGMYVGPSTRFINISFAGKKISEGLDINGGERDLGTLPDGQTICYENPGSGKTRTRLFFKTDGI